MTGVSLKASEKPRLWGVLVPARGKKKKMTGPSTLRPVAGQWQWVPYFYWVTKQGESKLLANFGATGRRGEQSGVDSWLSVGEF